MTQKLESLLEQLRIARQDRGEAMQIMKSLLDAVRDTAEFKAAEAQAQAAEEQAKKFTEQISPGAGPTISARLATNTLTRLLKSECFTSRASRDRTLPANGHGRNTLNSYCSMKKRSANTPRKSGRFRAWSSRTIPACISPKT